MQQILKFFALITTAITESFSEIHSQKVAQGGFCYDISMSHPLRNMGLSQRKNQDFSYRISAMNSAKTQGPLNNFFRREFFIDVSRHEPFAVQSGNGREVQLASLSEDEIRKLQDYASRQFRRSFYKESDNVEEHRATLYYLNNWFENTLGSRTPADRDAKPRKQARSRAKRSVT